MSNKRYKPVDAEAAAKEYWKRNFVLVGTILGGFLGFMFLSDFLLGLLGQNFRFVVLLWVIAVMIVATWRANWRCPRCGKKFFYKWWYSNAAAMKCVHCRFRP